MKYYFLAKFRTCSNIIFILFVLVLVTVETVKTFVELVALEVYKNPFPP